MVTATPPRQLTQRELLGLVLDRAEQGSACFARAHDIASHVAEDAEEAHRLARELLTDLTIRDWIRLVREDSQRAGQPVPRSRYEMELAAEANWDEDEPPTRYILTPKGRDQLERLLGTLFEPVA